MSKCKVFDFDAVYTLSKDKVLDFVDVYSLSKFMYTHRILLLFMHRAKCKVSDFC